MTAPDPGNIEVDEAAANLARHAWMETKGLGWQRHDAMLWAYEWAKANREPFRDTDLFAYPSLSDLRKAMAER